MKHISDLQIPLVGPHQEFEVFLKFPRIVQDLPPQNRRRRFEFIKAQIQVNCVNWNENKGLETQWRNLKTLEIMTIEVFLRVEGVMHHPRMQTHRGIVS